MRLCDINVFKVPKVNLDTADYINLIDRTILNITEPSLWTKISSENIKLIVNDDFSDQYLFPRLPGHKQAAKRRQ